MMRNSPTRALILAAGLTLMGCTASPIRAEMASAVQAAPTPPANRPQTEAERKAFALGDRSPKAIVNAFNQMAFFDHQPVEAMKTFLSEDFIERSPDFALEDTVSDKLAVIHFFETRGWKDGETMRDTIYQVIAEDDRVVVFHHVTMSDQDRGIAFVDIFRVNDGLIAEHWAIGEPVPAATSLRHSMF